MNYREHTAERNVPSFESIGKQYKAQHLHLSGLSDQDAGLHAVVDALGVSGEHPTRQYASLDDMAEVLKAKNIVPAGWAYEVASWTATRSELPNARIVRAAGSYTLHHKPATHAGTGDEPDYRAA